jgi:hypothetical protein
LNITFVSLQWLEQVNFQWDDDEVYFVLDQHAEFDFYSANSLKQQSLGRHVAPLRHIILIPSQLHTNRIGGVMVSVLASSVVDRVFEPRSDQTNDDKIGICCFSGW